jgi:hypothetical protein
MRKSQDDSPRFPFKLDKESGLYVPQKLVAQQGQKAQQGGLILAGAPLLIGGVIAGGWDAGAWRTLNLDTLRQLWRLSERIQPCGKLDGRNTVTATIAAGSAVGVTAEAALSVPSGELWFIQALEIVSPPECAPGQGQIVTVNFRISAWPDDDDSNEDGKLFWETARGTIATDTYWQEFFASGPWGDPENLDVPLRLVAADYITLIATLTGAAATAAMSATLTPYGYKAVVLGAS